MFSTKIFIDDIIVRYIDRNKYIIMMRDKFCLVDYNVLILCENDYCYVFYLIVSLFIFLFVFTYLREILILSRRFQQQ